ncbi:MAG TPA: cupin domain-containing protein [Lentisphaeria bacterium]|nr:cupin domain-containing protein [Lentisphaeria bacterium]
MTAPIDIPEDIVGNWQERGFSCDRESLAPGEVTDRRIHTFDQLIVLLSGEVTVEIAGETFKPAIGEELLIPAGTIRCINNHTLEPIIWLHGRLRPAGQACRGGEKDGIEG